MRLKVESPLDNQVFQQKSEHKSLVPVLGKVKCLGHPQLQVKITFDQAEGLKTDEDYWIPLNYEAKRKIFRGAVDLPAGGEYTAHIKILQNGKQKALKTVREIGAGEIFITLGQSNSANSGSEPTSPQSPLVSAWTGKKWVVANDPQPIATNTGGSPWPSMADLLYSKLKVPIGLISIGVGGSALAEWKNRDRGNYPRFLKICRYFYHVYGNLPANTPRIRAILWHQGETDCLNQTTTADYIKMLNLLIRHSREDLGQLVPWGIAQASFHPDRQGLTDQNIVDAQTAVGTLDLNFLGPNTDLLVGNQWRHDNVHFNKQGLKNHGEEWAICILNWMKKTGSL
jgi:hypothetical protein